MVLFVDPPYIPIIPSYCILIPFSLSFKSDNKISDYHILIKLSTDTVAVEDLKFYRNNKEIMPKSTNAIKISDSLYKNEMYFVVETNATTMYPHQYYLFTFHLRKFTAKQIEIKKKEDRIFYVKRKKKLEYKGFDFQVH